MVVYQLSVPSFNEIQDLLKQLGFYQLKDESQIPACSSYKNVTLDGQKLVEIRATQLTADGLQTTFVTSSAGHLRITSFYELKDSVSVCPQLKEWKTALQVRNYLKILFDTFSR